MKLSEKLSILCARQRLTQETLAQFLKIDQTTVSRWLTGKSRPYQRVAIQLADFFGVDVDELVDDLRTCPEPHSATAAQHYAKGQFPGNPKAGQEAFEKHLYQHELYKAEDENRRYLRAKAASLRAIANSLLNEASEMEALCVSAPSRENSAAKECVPQPALSKTTGKVVRSRPRTSRAS